MPKAELYVHIEGAIEAQTLFLFREDNIQIESATLHLADESTALYEH
ncbi:MAG: hypothetical protein ACPG8W_13620 [Candidatus Promineifilaceae bacterium]